MSRARAAAAEAVRTITTPEISALAGRVLLGVVLLLFGGRKLPELARGSGRALRIFKSEVKELNDGDQRDEHGQSRW